MTSPCPADGGEEVTLKVRAPPFDGGAETGAGEGRDFNCIMDRKTCRGKSAMTLARGSALLPARATSGPGWN